MKNGDSMTCEIKGLDGGVSGCRERKELPADRAVAGVSASRVDARGQDIGEGIDEHRGDGIARGFSDQYC